MIPIRLEIHNFLPYRAPEPLRFEGIHLACLTGPNGAGKSSILDAITWAIWGHARAKRDEDLIHQGQQDMSVQLDFEQEGMIYRVIRRRTRLSRGTGSLDLFVLDGPNGKATTISEPSMRATQDKINRLLRLDYETFINSAFLQQGNADAFTTKTPKERKQILSDILGLSQWEQYEENAKVHLKRITEDLSVITSRIDDIDTNLEREPGLKAVRAEAEHAHEEARAALLSAEERLEEVAHASVDMKNAREGLFERERRLREHERDLQTAEKDIEVQQSKVGEYEAVIAERDDVETGYATLQSAREADRQLADKLRELSDLDTRRNDLQRIIDAARAELEGEAKGCEELITELQRTLQNSHADDLDSVQAEVYGLQTLEAERDTERDDLMTMEKQRSDLDATNRALKTEMHTLKDRLDKLQALEDALCPLCGQPLDDASRAALIEQLQTQGNTQGDIYRENQTHISGIAATLKKQREHIQDLDLDLKRLSPLIERMGGLQQQAEAAQSAQIRLDETLSRLDSTQAVLAADDFANEARIQLGALNAERVALGYDSGSHDAAREQLETYRGYEARHTRLQVALDSLPNAQAALAAAHGRCERLQKALADDQTEIVALNEKIAQLGVLVEEQQARQQEVNRQRTAERSAYERLVNARQELDALDKQRERKVELEAKRGKLREEEALYKELRTAFSKNGIPAMIIETAIPELEGAANNLLQRMTNGRMGLRLATQREKVTGGVAETLEIQIADELGTRNYEMYSGGEAFRINFALRVALSQLLARRAGAHLRTLFIDEGFGTQDEEGRNRLVEAIVAIQDDFDLILVITHIDELRDSFPVHIVIDKTPSGSKIAVR